MKQYTKKPVSEAELEHLVRCYCEKIEEGLLFIDHQVQTDTGRLDVLLVDKSGRLVTAELKVVEDDAMLFQALDYYDYVTRHLETFARLYSPHKLDPTQPVRLLLIAPSFSAALKKRCKWIDVPISLCTYDSIQIEGDEDVVPIYSMHERPRRSTAPVVTTVDNHLSYITDQQVRMRVTKLLDQIKSWKQGAVALDPIKNFISMKVNGRVFAYLQPCQKHYWISTYTQDDVWADFPIKSEADLEPVLVLVESAMHRKSQLSSLPTA